MPIQELDFMPGWLDKVYSEAVPPNMPSGFTLQESIEAPTAPAVPVYVVISASDPISLDDIDVCFVPRSTDVVLGFVTYEYLQLFAWPKMRLLSKQCHHFLALPWACARQTRDYCTNYCDHCGWLTRRPWVGSELCDVCLWHGLCYDCSHVLQKPIAIRANGVEEVAHRMCDLCLEEHAITQLKGGRRIFLEMWTHVANLIDELYKYGEHSFTWACRKWFKLWVKASRQKYIKKNTHIASIDISHR